MGLAGCCASPALLRGYRKALSKAQPPPGCAYLGTSTIFQHLNSQKIEPLSLTPARCRGLDPARVCAGEGGDAPCAPPPPPLPRHRAGTGLPRIAIVREHRASCRHGTYFQAK